MNSFGWTLFLDSLAALTALLLVYSTPHAHPFATQPIKRLRLLVAIPDRIPWNTLNRCTDESVSSKFPCKSWVAKLAFASEDMNLVGCAVRSSANFDAVLHTTQFLRRDLDVPLFLCVQWVQLIRNLRSKCIEKAACRSGNRCLSSIFLKGVVRIVSA